VTDESRPDRRQAPVSDAGIDDAEPVEAELVEPDRDEAAYGTGAGAEAGGGNDAPADTSAASDAAPASDADSGSDADDVLAAAAAAVQVDLEELLKEREQFLGAYQRTHADFENFRKQAQKRQDEAVQRALGRFVESLLPVLDACDAAVAHGEAEAVEPIVGALYGALEKEGLERIDPSGGRFDPAEAEAVIHEPGEGGDQVVAEVMRTGYRWRGRVLRPAMVKVTD
jgi:molecular chaperone GrpE